MTAGFRRIRNILKACSILGEKVEVVKEHQYLSVHLDDRRDKSRLDISVRSQVGAVIIAQQPPTNIEEEDLAAEKKNRRRIQQYRDQMEGDSSDTSVTPSNRKCSWITGSARKIKDNAADWHNLMIRWDKLNDEGFNLAATIVNMRHSQGDPLVLDVCPPPSQSTWSSSAVMQQTDGAAELQDECLKLQDVVDRMVVVVKKMEHLMELQRGVLELEEFQFGPEGRRVPLCLSWKTREFEETSGVLLAAFSQELKLKRMILQEVAHTTTSDLSKVYLSCWLHQPFIPAATRLGLEALLLETGHRPL